MGGIITLAKETPEERTQDIAQATENEDRCSRERDLLLRSTYSGRLISLFFW